MHKSCYDVTDTGCQAQNGNVMVASFATFKHGFLTNQIIKQLKKSCEHNFYSISINGTHNASSFWISFKVNQQYKESMESGTTLSQPKNK